MMSGRKARLDEALEHFLEKIEVPRGEQDDELTQQVVDIVHQTLPEVKKAIREEVEVVLEELSLVDKLELLSESGTVNNGDDVGNVAPVKRAKVEESYRTKELENEEIKKVLQEMDSTLEQLRTENLALHGQMAQLSKKETQVRKLAEKATESLKQVGSVLMNEGAQITQEMNTWTASKEQGF